MAGKQIARDKFYEIVKPSESVAAITNASIMDYLASMNETLDYVTSNGYCQRVKTIVQFGIDNNKIKINPFCNIHLRKGEKNVQFLTEEEILFKQLCLHAYGCISYWTEENLADENSVAGILLFTEILWARLRHRMSYNMDGSIPPAPGIA